MSTHQSIIITIDRGPMPLKRAQSLVGGYVQLLTLPDESQLLINEDGIAQGLPLNIEATKRWPHWGPLLGNVVHLTGSARWK